MLLKAATTPLHRTGAFLNASEVWCPPTATKVRKRKGEGAHLAEGWSTARRLTAGTPS